MLYYSRILFGIQTYYVVEVKHIELEVDLSKVLTKLHSLQLQRIYLRLHNNQLLLISEEYDKEASKELCRKLQKIFRVEIKNLQKVAGSRKGEIRLGDYIIHRELSHGGMGKILLAEEKNTKQLVALKILPANVALKAKYISSFAREIQILQRLAHPGIVKILHLGREVSVDSDIYFYAMEYIEGRTVSELIRSQELTLEKAVVIAIQAALALDYLHDNQIIHRDIKPSNIMVRNTGQVVLIDFGIARDTALLSDGNAHYSSEDDMTHNLGTLPYMSPEQLNPKATIDHRTDIYSLGVTLYEMLASQRPFIGGNQALFRAILYQEPNEPSAINHSVPKELDTISMKAMEKNPKRRYQTGAEMAEDLHRWLRGEPLISQPIGTWRKLWRKFWTYANWLSPFK